MVDISQPFVIDNAPSERFPVYTRANTGEVAGGVITPLRWTLNGGMVVESLDTDLHLRRGGRGERRVAAQSCRHRQPGTRHALRARCP